MIEFYKLGESFEALLAQVAGRIAMLLEAGVRENRVISVLSEAHLDGTIQGYRFHGDYLRAPSRLAPSVLDRWWAEAESEARRLSKLLDARLVEQARGMDWVGRWLSSAGQQTVMRGGDYGGLEAGRAGQAQWKQWVRAWRRDEQRRHSYLEGRILPLEDLFTLPSGKRVFGPRDWGRVNDPEEHINCGHALTYLQEVTRAQLEEVYAPPTESAVFR